MTAPTVSDASARLINQAVTHAWSHGLAAAGRYTDDQDEIVRARFLESRASADALRAHVAELEAELARYKEPFTGYDSDEGRDALYSDTGVPTTTRGST
jgi:hypothetical protein